MIDPIEKLAFSIYENPGVYALLLGSGVSRGAQIPTGWEVTLDLVRRAAAAQGVADVADWAAWYRGTFQKDPAYGDVLEMLAGTPAERRSILHSYIEPSEDDRAAGRKTPTAAHRAVASLVKGGFVKVILTTNFDRLIENALRAEGIEPSVIDGPERLSGALPIQHAACTLIKLHGDYFDTRIRNTDEELQAYEPELERLLDRIIDEYGLVVCGWSADWDHALRASILRAPSRRFSTFWAARGTPSVLAGELITQRGATVCTIDSADAFFSRLAELVELQVKVARPNPDSVALLIEATKAALAAPPPRIALADLVRAEVRRHRAKTEPLEEALHVSDWPSVLRDRVVAQEAATERLCRVFGLVGLWGDEEAHGSLVDSIGVLARTEPAGGLVPLIETRAYPAVLLFYAVGAALTYGKRWKSLLRLIHADVALTDRKPSKAVDRLFGSEALHQTRDIWNPVFHGGKQRKTPLSDHINDLARLWCEDYIIDYSEYERNFLDFENICTLEAIATSYPVSLLEKAGADSGPQGFLHAPYGRPAWKRDEASNLPERFGPNGLGGALRGAGFFRGNDNVRELAVRLAQRVYGRVGRF